jgi:hypothetical protein
LSELSSVFSDIFAGFLSPAGAFPSGSVILISSLSHLGRHRICNYTDALVHIIGSLVARVGAGVEVVPRVLLPLGRIGDPGWVRDAYDLKRLDPGLCPRSGGRARGCSGLRMGEPPGAGGEGAASHSGHSLFLPMSSGTRGRGFSTRLTPIPPLPCWVPPIRWARATFFLVRNRNSAT